MAAGLPLSTLLSQVLVAFTNTARLIVPKSHPPVGGTLFVRICKALRKAVTARRASSPFHAPAVPLGEPLAGNPQVVLGHRPILREGLFRVDLQSILLRLNCPPSVPIGVDRATAFFPASPQLIALVASGVRVEAAEAFPGRAEVPAIEVDGPTTWALL